jgi:hypothetical protein
MPDFDTRLLNGVEDGPEAVETDDQLRTRKERHYGALADPRIADHDDCLAVLLVHRDRLHAFVDEGPQLGQVYWAALLE